jgi:hypothetical protein
MKRWVVIGVATFFGLTACNSVDAAQHEPKDPMSAPLVAIDRFSSTAAKAMVRGPDNDLPGPDEPIDFDVAPFVTRGLGPVGQSVRYYNFDIRERMPPPIYMFVLASSGEPVPDQLPVIGVVPGEAQYNDFWLIHRVEVSDSYRANTLTSTEAIAASSHSIEVTDRLLNGPVVPKGSTATLRIDGADPNPKPVWYKDQIAYVLEFERDLVAARSNDGDPLIPLAYIWVTFNINPSEPGGGPVSGFMTEPGTDQTHNVVEALPGSTDYSPLWMVIAYDNASFESVLDRASAELAPVAAGSLVPTVNCPLVSADAP